MNIRKIVLSSLLFSSFLTKVYGGIYDELYEKALLTSPVIQRIHEDSLEWRAQEEKELSGLVSFIKDHPNREESLKERVKEDLESDLIYFSTLEKMLKPFKVRERGTLHQLKYNKMALGIQRALSLLEASFDDIIEGNLPEGYSLTPPKVITIGDADHIYASGRGIALKHLLVRTVMQLTGVSITGLGNVLGFEPKSSPFIQYTPLPIGFSYEGLENSPYFIRTDNNKCYIVVLHNGYTYGGHRDEAAKPFGPEDCSSFIAKYAGCQPITTRDQAIYYQLEEGFQFTGPQFDSVVKEWKDKEEGYQKNPCIVSLQKTMAPVKIFDVSHVKPGFVHAEQAYEGVKADPKIALSGNNGHTSFVIDVLGQGRDAKVITLGANRDLEGTNRDFIFGLEPRPYMLDLFKNQKMIMYFKLKK